MQMYNKILTVCLVMVSFIQACKDKDGFTTTESGLKYRFLDKAEGAVSPQDGEIITLNLKMVNTNDSVLVDAQEMALEKNDSIWGLTGGGIEEAFSLLSQGDSMEVKVNAGDLFQRTWRMPLPPNMSADEEIICNIKLVDIYTIAAYQRMEAMKRVPQVEAIRERTLADSQEQMETDGAAIDAYLIKNNIEAETTQNGLRYVIMEEGNGESPQVGDQVKVNYTGNVLEGEYFDTSVEDKAVALGLHDPRRPYIPFEFFLGTGGVIHGWDEGIGLLKKGSIARFYIPSPMGYGNQQRSEVIVPNSILEFEVELVDIVSN